MWRLKLSLLMPRSLYLFKKVTMMMLYHKWELKAMRPQGKMPMRIPMQRWIPYKKKIKEKKRTTTITLKSKIQKKSRTTNMQLKKKTKRMNKVFLHYLVLDRIPIKTFRLLAALLEFSLKMLASTMKKTRGETTKMTKTGLMTTAFMKMSLTTGNTTNMTKKTFRMRETMNGNEDEKRSE